MTTCLYFDHLKVNTFDAVVFGLPVHHILLSGIFPRAH